MAKEEKERRRKVELKIEIPSDIDVNIDGNEITIKKGTEEAKRKFKTGKVQMKKEGNLILISAEKATKREKRLAGTLKAHINNMIKGLNEPYNYKLQICNVHFPMSVSVSPDKKKVIIKNFLGETKERTAKILDGVEVEVKGQIITITSRNKEKGGQTAANIEKTTRIKSKDRRIFQDGIFLVSRAGKEI